MIHYLSIILLLGVCLSGCGATPKPVTFVMLPDTQTYAEKYPHIMDAQIDWILDNRETIDFVLQQGDLTQNNSEEEWCKVRQSFARLDGVVPYSVVVGNHDMGSEPGKFADVRDTTRFNTAFPVSLMAQLPAYSGAFEPGKTDNTYYLFRRAGRQWMVLNLEFGPRNEVLAWANELVQRYPDTIVLLNTHAYMYSDDTRQGEGDYWRAQDYGIGDDQGASQVNDGEQIWEKLVTKNENIRFVLSGHVLNQGVGTLVSHNEAGRAVYQFLANFQEGVKGSENGGNGWLRIMKVWPQKGTLEISTYSPYLDRESNDPRHQLRYDNVNL